MPSEAPPRRLRCFHGRAFDSCTSNGIVQSLSVACLPAALLLCSPDLTPLSMYTNRLRGKTTEAARQPSSPRATAKSPAAKSSSLDKELKKRSSELAASRDSLRLAKQPVRTLLLFCHASVDFLLDTAKSAAQSKLLVFLGLPLCALYLGTRWIHPQLYAAPGCGEAGAAAGPLYATQLWAYEALWWLVLGILSSIGFGSGLHSGESRAAARAHVHAVSAPLDPAAAPSAARRSEPRCQRPRLLRRPHGVHR